MICWVIAAASQRYKVSLIQVAGAVLVMAFMFRFLVPYSQYGRNLRPENGSLGDTVDVAISLLTSLGTVRQEYMADQQAAYEAVEQGYYNTPQGFFDRLR